jgi:hypothetical protein
MIIYKVTTELKTPWWVKVLRFFRVKKGRTEFEICLNYDGYNIGELLLSSAGQYKILGKEHQEGTFVSNLGFC